MKLIEIIAEACEMLSRHDLAEKLRADGFKESALPDEQKETLSVLVYCENAVEDELARNYFPLYASEQKLDANGLFYFSGFKNTPVKILGVKCGGRSVDFKLHPQYVEVNAESVEIEYTFAPAKKGLSEDSSFPLLSPALIASGVAAEYCLIEGEVSRAESWESRYRAEIDAARAKTRPDFIPPRRWV